MIGAKFKIKTIYNLLNIIYTQPLTQRQIAQKLNKNTEMICNQVKRLRERGLVFREEFRLINKRGKIYIKIYGELIPMNNIYHKKPKILFLTEKGQQLYSDIDNIKYILEYIE